MGAREVATECRSFSKNAGFTGMHLAYTIVPKELLARGADGNTMSLNPLWARRTAIKFNGPPYIIQKATAAVATPSSLMNGTHYESRLTRRWLRP